MVAEIARLAVLGLMARELEIWRTGDRLAIILEVAPDHPRPVAEPPEIAEWRSGCGDSSDTAPCYGFGLSERRGGDAVRSHPEAMVSSKVGR
jgi:hypothetical protein